MTGPGWDTSSLEAGLAQAVAAIRDGQRSGLQSVGDDVLAQANDRVPVLTGELRASGTVVVSGDEVAIAYTDSKAVGAHENMADRHPGGRSAKFLEQPLTANPDGVGQRIADAIRGELGG